MAVGAVIAAAVAAGSPLPAGGQTIRTWNKSGAGSWGDPLNWSPADSFAQNGDQAVFGVTPAAAGLQTVQLDRAVALSKIGFDGPIQYKVQGGGTNQITLTGPSVLDVSDTGIPYVGFTPPGHSLLAGLSGQNGLVKTGAGTLHLGNQNTFVGDVVVRGGTLAVSSAGALGAASNRLVLEGGTARFYGMTYPQNIHLGAAGGTVEMMLGTSLLGAISGEGPLTFATGPVGSEDTIVGFHAQNTYTGATHVRGVQMTLVGQGSIARSSGVDLPGILVLSYTNGIGIDRIGDDAPVDVRGGVLLSYGPQTGVVEERIGTVTFAGGGSGWVSTHGNSRIVAKSLRRLDRSTFQLFNESGRGLIAMPGGEPALSGTGALGTVQAPVLPWGAIQVIGDDYALATYDSIDGVRALRPGEYLTSMPSGLSESNVVLSADASVDAPSTINALEFPRSPVTPTVPVNLSGAGPLRVLSGAVRGALGTVWVPLEFGDAEAVFQGALLNLNGPIGGNNGVTIGRGVVNLNGTNTYTGPTTLAGWAVISGDVLPGVPGPLGADSSPVRLVAGRWSGLLGFAGTNRLTFARDIHVEGAGQQFAKLTTPPTGVGSTRQYVITGDIRLGTRLEVEPGIELAGKISGPGGLYFKSGGYIGGSDNTYSGGTVAHRLTVAGDNALGTGPLYITSEMDLSNGLSRPLTLSNPVRVGQQSARFTFRPGNELILSGPVTLSEGGVKFQVGGPLTITGTLSGGGPIDIESTFVLGKLTLAGPNTYTGLTTIGTNTVLNVRHPQALGTVDQPTRATRNGAVVEFEGNVVGGLEPMELMSDIRSVGGDNSWDGPISFATGSATANITTGSLTLGQPLGASKTLTKTGVGVLKVPYVRSDALNITNGQLHIKSAPGNNNTSRVRTLAIPGTSRRLHIGNQAMLIDYFGPSPGSAIADLVKLGKITGDGAVGVGEASGLLHLSGTQTANYRGQVADATTLILLATVQGDADLNGVVSFPDLVALAQNYNRSPGTQSWWKGDFNNDAKVDFADLVILAQNYGAAAPAEIGGQGAAFAADVEVAFAQARVPEPGVWGIAIFAITSLGMRRPGRRSGLAS